GGRRIRQLRPHRALREDQPFQAEPPRLRAGPPAKRITGRPRPWPRWSSRPSCWKRRRSAPTAAVSCVTVWSTATSPRRASCRAGRLIARRKLVDETPRLLGPKAGSEIEVLLDPGSPDRARTRFPPRPPTVIRDPVGAAVRISGRAELPERKSALAPGHRTI